MSNPYAPSPFRTQGFQQPSIGPKVSIPAIALMIVAPISIFTCMAGLLIDVVFIATGVVERQETMNLRGELHRIKMSPSTLGSHMSNRAALRIFRAAKLSTGMLKPHSDTVGEQVEAHLNDTPIVVERQ